MAGVNIDIAMFKWHEKDKVIERMFIAALYVYGLIELARVSTVRFVTRSATSLTLPMRCFVVVGGDVYREYSPKITCRKHVFESPLLPMTV